MLTKKELKDKRITFSRKEIAERAREIAQLCSEGNYKNSITCIGRMVALSKTIEDCYWDEKLWIGAEREKYYLLSRMDKKHPDRFNTI